jgi:hypothetical protein
VFNTYPELLEALGKHVTDTKHHRFEYWKVLRGHAFDCESCGQVFEHNLAVRGQKFHGVQTIVFIVEGRIYVTSILENGHSIEHKLTRYDRDFVI